MDNPFSTPTIISYCTGFNGLERGLERAIGSIRTAVYVEIEAFICENLLAGMESGVLVPTPIWSNLKTFDATPFRGKVHGIIGGYPCQPFSNAGNRKGTDDPRHLYPFISKHIETIRPVWCFFENVAGHLTLGFDEVYRDLSDLGYAVEAGIFTAEEVGAPHRRERLFILAIRKDKLEYSKSWGAGIIRNSTREGYGATGRGGILQSGSQLADSNSIRHAYGELKEQSTKAWQYAQRNTTTGGEHELAYCNNEGLQGMRKCSGQERWETPDRYIRGGGEVWPARPGKPQYEWEEPRTTFAPLGGYVDGNPNRIDILYLNKTYEAYTGKKERSIKALSDLWATVESKKNEWTIGGLYNFLEKEILLSSLHGAIKNNRLVQSIKSYKNNTEVKGNPLRSLPNEEITISSSQGQEYYKQLQREFADAMCIMSYQITLAGRKEAKSGSEFETLQYLWDNYENAWWNVSEALYPVQEIWQPITKKEYKRQIEDAYKSYRLDLFGNLYGYNFREDLLRAYGNSVVEQTAELAFRKLLAKLIISM